MTPRAHDRTAPRRLFLAAPPEHGTARLHADDVDHALKVLRLAAGHELVALDGRGHAWNARVASVARREVALERLELVADEPPPGAPGSACGHVTIHVALPRPGPAEEMLDRLTQLGTARIVPLVTERSGPHARDLSAGRRERFERVAREALKQSGRLWMPEITEPLAIEDWRALHEPSVHERECAAVLSPEGERAFLSWALAEHERGVRRWTIVVGPEGGLTEAEEALLCARGAVRARLARSILRIETAAEAAVAVLAAIDAGA